MASPSKAIARFGKLNVSNATEDAFDFILEYLTKYTSTTTGPEGSNEKLLRVPTFSDEEMYRQIGAHITTAEGNEAAGVEEGNLLGACIVDDLLGGGEKVDDPLGGGEKRRSRGQRSAQTPKL